MKNQAKSIKILEELIRYFTYNGIRDLAVRYTSTTETLIISVSGETATPPKDLAELERLLKTPRRLEFEEYYWSLLGASTTRNELDILGTLVDNARVTYENGIVTVMIERKE
jgi:hypothetical protein